MSLNDIIQSLGIISAIAIAIWQMTVQTRHTRAMNDLTLLAKFDEINKLWIDHPGLWNLLNHPYKKNQSGNSLETLENLMFIVFNTLELVFRHYKTYRLIENEDWNDWRNTIQAYKSKAYWNGWWAENAHEFNDSFQVYINKLPCPHIQIKGTQPTAPQDPGGFLA